MEGDQKNKKLIFKRYLIFIIAIIAIILFFVLIKNLNSRKNNSNKVLKNRIHSAAGIHSNSSVSQRKVSGKAANLNSGTYTCGKDIQAGLYDVTVVTGEGNFTVKNDNILKVNEILGNSKNMGVSKVRVRIEKGDTIQIQNVGKVHFEPVKTPFVTAVQAIDIYSGKWIVGKDIAPSKYAVTAGSGSGNFVVDEIIDQKEAIITNEILKSNDNKNVLVDLKNGDIVCVTGLNQVTLTPSK